MSNRHGLKGFSQNAIPALSACMSPIEGKFVQAFIDLVTEDGYRTIEYYQNSIAKCACKFNNKTNMEWYTLHLLVQARPFAESTKSVDAVVFATGRVSILSSAYIPITSIASVELDGKRFHETTEQICNDRSKDRRLALGQWYPIRFTGSEVYNNPTGCASEVLDIVVRAFTSKQEAILDAEILIHDSLSEEEYYAAADKIKNKTKHS